MKDIKELTLEEKIKMIDEISSKIGDPNLPINEAIELFQNAKVLYDEIEKEIAEAKKLLN